jgi:hypothetical protein
MKFRIVSAAVIICATLPLAGCEFLTPNWDALRPTDTPTTAQPTDSPTPTEEPTTTPDLDKVGVVVFQVTADEGGIDVVANVPSVSEDGGTCTLIVSQAGTKQEITVKAESNVTDTQCFPMFLPRKDFVSGPATFTVSYLSSTSSGVSAPIQVVFP